MMQIMLPEPGERRPIRHEYEEHGVDGFYQQSGATYRNPHEPQIRKSIRAAVRDWSLDLKHVLDLAAGSGEATLALRDAGATRIDGIDPFTFEAYLDRTGQIAGRETFEQIAAGALAGRNYSLIVCSFAFHLIEPSRLPQVAYQLSTIANQLLILTPHKRPQIREAWGWALTQERVMRRVRSRLYQSLNHTPNTP
jgi:hypothetical protein